MPPNPLASQGLALQTQDKHWGLGLERCQSCFHAVKGKIKECIKAKKPNQALCPSWHFLQETTSKADAPELKSTGLELSTWRNHILQMHPEKSNQCEDIPAGHQEPGWLLSWLCQGHRECAAAQHPQHQHKGTSLQPLKPQNPAG